MPLIPALEKNTRREETALRLSLILGFLEAGSPFWTEVEVRANDWLFCFSGLQVEPQYLSLIFFINSATIWFQNLLYDSVSFHLKRTLSFYYLIWQGGTE